MDEFTDVFGGTVFLDGDVKQVVFAKHPEVNEFFDRIESVLNNPDLVKRSKLSKRADLYYRYFEDIFHGKYLVVVVKKVAQKFISTFYITDKVKEGEIIWQKST